MSAQTTTNLTHRRPGFASAMGGTGSIEKDAEIMADPSKFVVPSLTMKELLAAIPSHCFERSAIKSSVYVLADIIVIGILAYAATFIPSLSNPSTSPVLASVPTLYRPVAATALNWTMWMSYWFVQGLFGTAIWIVGHECGHQAYSASKTINNSVGWVLHSLLLVPYHPWRISHGRHHAATGHMTRDEVFVPKTRSQRNIPPIAAGENEEVDEGTLRGTNVPQMQQLKVADILEDAPIYTLYNLVLQQVFGWPMYLFTNASGQRHYPEGTNHFKPGSVIFEKRHFTQVIASDFGLLLTLGGLAYWAQCRGVAEVIKFWFIPYLWVNHFLVMITFLQHTDPSLPHYREGLWNFQRGALATIDRNMMGFVGPYILHGITETHVCHHLVSKIPHYNAWEATEALKKVLGPHYKFSNENMWVSLYKNYRNCHFVEDTGDIIFFKNSKGQAAREVVWPDLQGVSDSGVDLQ